VTLTAEAVVFYVCVLVALYPGVGYIAGVGDVCSFCAASALGVHVPISFA
jgi:hypothetical protein